MSNSNSQLDAQSSVDRLAHVTTEETESKPMRKIGPFLSLAIDEPLTMQTAYETDFESGSHWHSNALAKECNRQFPTIIAMAALIEKERDRLQAEVDRLRLATSPKAVCRRSSKTGMQQSNTNMFNKIKQFFKDFFSCPYGWEDKNGFHYGHPPVEIEEIDETEL
jgi:hypothetical protein